MRVSAGRSALGAYAAIPGVAPDEWRVWAEERQMQALDSKPPDLLQQLIAPEEQKEEPMPIDHDAVSHQQRLLAIHRRTLAILLEQQAVHTSAYVPPSVVHGIAEARAQIARIKAALRGWGLPAEDGPDDLAPASEA